MLRTEYENTHRLEIQRCLLPLLAKFQIYGTTDCIRITAAIHEFSSADEILRKMTCKEPGRSVLRTSRITRWQGNLLPLLWVYLLENCPPFLCNLLCYHPLLCMWILLYYLSETSSSKSRFSRGFVFSLKTKAWLIQLCPKYFIPNYANYLLWFKARLFIHFVEAEVIFFSREEFKVF